MKAYQLMTQIQKLLELNGGKDTEIVIVDQGDYGWVDHRHILEVEPTLSTPFENNGEKAIVIWMGDTI